MKRFKPSQRYDFAKGKFVANTLTLKRKKNTSPTNQLTNAITNHIRLCGGYAMRINVAGFYRPELGKYIRSGSTLGTPDLIAIVSGWFVGIEIKVDRDSQSPDQKAVQQGIEAAGGVYLLVKDFDQFKNDFKSVIKSSLPEK